MSKFIYDFWISYGLVKIKVPESSTPCIITHKVDLETMFSGNPLLKNISKEWVGIAHNYSVFLQFAIYVSKKALKKVYERIVKVLP